MPDSKSLVLSIKCLQYSLVYLNGVEYLRKKPHLLIKLYDLVAHPETEVRKHVIQILCGLAKVMQGAFISIDRAAINNARRGNRSPYQKIVESLGQLNAQQDDVDLKVITLTFINWMIFKCPSEKKLCKFLSRLENLGIYDELRALSKTTHPELIRQLKNF